MILRILVDDRLAPGSSCPWIAVAADGRTLRHGTSPPDAWPAADRIEGVLAAAHARLVTVRLPALPRQRLDRAAAYAIEDQLATPIESSAVAASPRSDGTTQVAVATQTLVAKIAGFTPRIARLVPETALAPIGRDWTWYASGAGGGFVRRADGSSFAATPAGADGEPPAELSAALAQARHQGAAPQRVEVAFDVPATTLARWSERSAVAFTAVSGWRWQDADAQAWRDAPDFLARRDAGAREGGKKGALPRALRLPLLLLAIALGVEIAGLAIEWTTFAIQRWQASSALAALAQRAGITATGGPETIANALARRHRELLHHAGKEAPADALLLLARAAAPLAALPRAAVTAATYGDGAWTLTVTGVDASALDALVRRLKDAGIDALAVPVASGARLRLALDPAAS
ncbi:MAG TPA: type II secretion system protein GspL [Casimicrobiaceae bacterium]